MYQSALRSSKLDQWMQKRPQEKKVTKLESRLLPKITTHSVSRTHQTYKPERLESKLWIELHNNQKRVGNEVKECCSNFFSWNAYPRMIFIRPTANRSNPV